MGFKDTPYLLIVALAAGTGARINELLALRWVDGDLEGKTLRIERAVKPIKTGLEIGPPKTKRSRRRIGIDDALVALLDSERDRQETEQLGLHGPLPQNVSSMRKLLPDDALIFPLSPFQPAEPRRHGTISKAFATRAAKLGFPGFRFHDLRHTHASLLLQAGVPIHAVSARLGHASPTITLGVYAHVLADAEAMAAQAASALLANALKDA